MKKQRILWRTGAAVAYLGMLVVNGLAGSTTVIGGVNTAEISDSYPNLFAPAGFTFAIWGVIYLLLGAYTIYSLLALRRPKAVVNQLIDKLTPLYLATSIVNAVWLFCWQFRVLGLSVVLMLALLGLLIKIRTTIAATELGPRQHKVIGWAFSVYFGWITVATIANITTWLVSINWNGFGLSGAAWMVTILLVGAAIANATIWRFKDPAYGLVIVWAYWGILSKQLAPDAWNSQYPGVISVLYSMLALIAVVIAIVTWPKAPWRNG